jgi:hypothetical protein
MGSLPKPCVFKEFELKKSELAKTARIDTESIDPKPIRNRFKWVDAGLAQRYNKGGLLRKKPDSIMQQRRQTWKSSRIRSD